MGKMKVEVYGLTDIGQRRELNEDNYRICGFENGDPLGVCILADGMGGHNAGEVASLKTVEIISEELVDKLAEEDNEKICLNIAEAIDFANAQVYGMSISSPTHAGMGTTTIVAYVKGDSVQIANIGDSRVYSVSQTGIRKITTDHSVVEQLVKNGTISPEEARMHPDKNLITRALGTEEFVDADFYDYTVCENETILLCSDGLTEMVYEEDIKEIINSADCVKSAVEGLVSKANDNGGVDNITVICVQFKREETL